MGSRQLRAAAPAPRNSSRRLTFGERRSRDALLASTAFTGVFVALVAGNSTALAACSGENTASVTCDAVTPATAGTLTTIFAGTTVVNVNPGGAINTGGATALVSAAGSLTFNHNDPGGITNLAGAGVFLGNGFGATTYLGNAAVTATGDGVFASNSGSADTITLTSNATVTSTTASGISAAVLAPGAGNVLINGSGNALGAQNGISVLNTGTGGGITISGSGAATGTTGSGIVATIFSGSDILIDRSGAVSGAFGIVASTNGTGNITVTPGSTVTSTAGAGIQVLHTNNAVGTSGSLHVGGSGSVNATGGIGIDADIQGANNAGSVLVDYSGNVTATDTGIRARTVGSGNLTVIGTGNVSSSGNRGIGAVTTGTGSVLVAPTGTVSGTVGILAGTTFAGSTGTTTVNVSNDVTGTTAEGVGATGGIGLVTVNVTGGTIRAATDGIAATGFGGVTVNMTGGQVGTLGSRTGDDGIGALSTGATGDVIVTATNVFSTGIGINAGSTAASTGNVGVTVNGTVDASNGIGISAVIGNVGSTGNVTVRANGNVLSANGRGIDATTFGSGDVLVTGPGSVSANGFGNGGIFAGVVGTSGNVTVSGSGGVTATGSNALVAQILNAANNGAILVDRSGVISGTAGIFAATTGGGTATVNVSNDVTATSGNAVDVGTGNGLASINVSGGTILAAGIGVGAFVTGNGGARVNMTGGQVGTAAQRPLTGISALVQGTAGDINVVANSVFSTGDGILAQFTNLASIGNANIAINTGATVNSSTGIGISLDGGVSNTILNPAVISGNIGVQTTRGSTAITNSGGVTGTGGVALQLGGANNLFFMDGPAATLTGNAIGSGTDTFRLGGSGANSFNVGQIGAGWTLLDKAGPSTWTVTGTSTYGGPATVSAGTLLVNGNLASSNGITVASGATLGGIGTLPNTTINAGGSFAPGNSIGTISIAGNLTFVGAGNYVVEVSPTAADRANASGTAALSGTLQAVGTGGTYTVGQRYTVLNATGGITGTFGNLAIAGNFGATRPHVEYDANNVYLVLDQALITPSLIGGTPNQRAVAGAIDTALTAGSTAAPFLALFGLSAAQLPGALDQLSGEAHVSVAGVLADESLYVRSAVLGRLRQASYGSDATMASLSSGGPLAFLAQAVVDDAFASLPYDAKSPRLPVKAPLRAPQATSDVVFWAQGFGAWGRFETDGNAATIRRDLAGFITGVDTRVGGNGRLGIAAGYTGSKNALDARGSANVDTGHIAGYGGWNFGSFNLRAGGAYAFHTIDTDRLIAFPGFFDRATAHYDGHTGQIFGELGYGFALANVAVEPFAGAAWVRVKTDATAERGGLAALNVAGTTFETGYATLGLRAAGLLPLGNDMVLIPRGTLAWQHAFNNVTPAGVLAFQAAPVPFVIAGVPIARDSLLAEAGLDLAVGRHATLGVAYTGQLANTVQDHAAKGKFSWRF